MEKVELQDLGLIDYKRCWDYQEKLNKQSVDVKIQQRKEQDFTGQTQHHLLLCEHPLVYTLGKSGSEDNLLLDQSQLDEKHATFYKINRGGDITHHGPGQLVAYPIFDLEKFYTDIHRFLRELEETVMLTLAHYGIESGRYEGYTGVWLDADDPIKARKICAMGIRCSRWVTMHGIALNVNNQLEHFDSIVPCGIKDKDVTSIAQELGREIDMEELKSVFLNKLAEVFHLEFYSNEAHV